MAAPFIVVNNMYNDATSLAFIASLFLNSGLIGSNDKMIQVCTKTANHNKIFSYFKILISF